MHITIERDGCISCGLCEGTTALSSKKAGNARLPQEKITIG